MPLQLNIAVTLFTCTAFNTSVRSGCLSPGPKPVDFMWDQQLYNLVGPLDQQHFIVTKL